jgi:hypothetical protein
MLSTGRRREYQSLDRTLTNRLGVHLVPISLIQYASAPIARSG